MLLTTILTIDWLSGIMQPLDLCIGLGAETTVFTTQEESMVRFRILLASTSWHKSIAFSSVILGSSKSLSLTNWS